MPKPPSVGEVPRPRPRCVIVIDDDGGGGGGSSRREARSAMAAGGQGGRRVKSERPDDGSGRVWEGSGAGGRALVAIAPQPQNRLTPSSRTVARTPSSAEVIVLDDDDEEEDVRREIHETGRPVKAEPVDYLEDSRAGGRASVAVAVSGGVKEARKGKREPPGRSAKENRASGRATKQNADPGSSSRPRNSRAGVDNPSSSAFFSGDESSSFPSKVQGSRRWRGGEKRRRTDRDAATPVKQVRAVVASWTRSRTGEQTRVLSAQVAFDDGEAEEEEEEQGVEAEDKNGSNNDEEEEAEEDSDNRCKTVAGTSEKELREEEQGVETEDKNGSNNDEEEEAEEDSDNRCKTVAGTSEKVLGEDGDGIDEEVSDEESSSSAAEEEEEENEDDDYEYESDHGGEELRATPSNAASGGNARTANKGSQVYGKRIFDGLCLLDKVDDTTSSGQGLRKRTRSNFKERKCMDKKLLKRGTFSKPYCIDASESSSESEKDAPPPVPQTQKQPPPEYEDDSSGDHRAPAKRRRRSEHVPNSDESEDQSSDSEDQSDDPGEERTFARNTEKGSSSRRPKLGATYQHNIKEGCKNSDGSNPRQIKKNFANAGNPTDRGVDDISFRKNALFSQKMQHGEIYTNQNTYTNLVNSIFDEIESFQNGSVPPWAQNYDKFPLVFSFGDEDQVVEKSENDKVEQEVWEEFDFALESINVGSHGCEEGEDCNGQENHAHRTTPCSQGEHDLIIDDQIGVWCKNCNFINLEIRHVVPPMAKMSTDREAMTDRELGLSINDILTSMGNEGSCSTTCHKTGPVWDLIPGVRENLFPHQRKAFEFMWTKLEGGIDIEQLKRTVNSDTLSGCVISHAPGTGKTRLAITFVQSYLERFPRCHPVIIAPKGMLATWEQEFIKWNVKLPFHVLNSRAIHWSEDKTIRRLAENDDDLTQRLSLNKPDQQFRRRLKLASWYEGNSIIGLSYSLFRKLADEQKKREPSEGDDGNGEDRVRRLLLQIPDLLVLDEGHRPRNKRSRIWKVLKEVRTQKRIILTGTLFQNNFEELHNVLSLLRIEDDDDVEKAFWASSTLKNITDERVDKIREKLQPFMHIHNGAILHKSLPGKKETIVILNPLPDQKKIITMIESSKTSGNFDIEYKISLASVHPSLVACIKNLSDEVASVVDKPLSRLNPSEGVKTRFVFEIVRLCEPLKERVLVFSQYLEPLDLILEQLSKKFNWTKGKEILQMSGNVRVEERQALMEAFNDMKSEAKVMLASTKACGEGITLIGASRVVLLDVVWNPSVERQAIGRAYRIGQKKIVYTYNLIAEGTLEKGKYDRQAKKDHMSKLLFSNEPQLAGSPEFSFNDRILETMTEHEKLKDMFVNILPSSQ